MTDKSLEERLYTAKFLPKGTFILNNNGLDGELNCDCFEIHKDGRAYILAATYRGDDIIKRRSRWIEGAPKIPGWYWHLNGGEYNMRFVFPRPGHSYLAIQEETGSGKRHFTMTDRMGGKWFGPLNIPLPEKAGVES